MVATAIEWADNHWEPVGGCTDEGPGCVNCYARERQLPRLAGAHPERYNNLIKLAPMGAKRSANLAPNTERMTCAGDKECRVRPAFLRPNGKPYCKRHANRDPTRNTLCRPTTKESI